METAEAVFGLPHVDTLHSTRDVDRAVEALLHAYGESALARAEEIETRLLTDFARSVTRALRDRSL